MPHHCLLEITALLSVFFTSTVISFVDHHFDSSFSAKRHRRFYYSGLIRCDQHIQFSTRLELLKQSNPRRQIFLNVQPSEEYSDDFDDKAIRLQATDFFNELRGSKSLVAISDLASSYYFEEMLQDGVVTKKTLSDLAGGRRQMNFELFYSVCSSLNQFQDDYFEKLSVNEGEIERRDEARKSFNELRGEGSKVSLAALKELYYFDEMLADGVITKDKLSDVVGKKRLLDFDSFYKVVLEFDKLNRVKTESSNPDVEANQTSNEVSITSHINDTAHSPASDRDEEMEIRREMTEDEVENARIADEKEARDTAAVLDLFDKLSSGSEKASVESFKGWSFIKNMITEKVIEESTVDCLTGLLGITDSELNLSEFEQLLRLFDESTGSGIIEVKSPTHDIHFFLSIFFIVTLNCVMIPPSYGTPLTLLYCIVLCYFRTTT